MEILMCVMMFLLGICLGSFYACMGYRIPNKISTIYPGSFCPNCKKPLKWYMNIPLFSYIFLRGKCAYCKKKISPFYFITELLGGVLFLISYLYFGFSLELMLILVLISMLLITIVTDFRYYYISDRVLLIGSILLFIINYNINNNRILYYVLSGVGMFLLMLFVKILGDKLFKKESLGGGDIKLMVPIGITLGVVDALGSLFISSVLALVVGLFMLRKNEDAVVPFGPFLILGAMIMYLFVYNGFNFW